MKFLLVAITFWSFLLGSLTVSAPHSLSSAFAADDSGSTSDVSDISSASEDPIARMTTISLDSNAAADDYASELISQYRAKQAALGPDQSPQEIVLVHLGDEPPAELKWVILRLDAEHIPYRMMLVTAQELEQTLADGQQKAEQLILVKSEGSSEEGLARVRDLGKDSRLFLKQLYGLPDGLTLWFFDVPALGLKKSPMVRTQEERSTELRLAKFSALSAGAQVAMSQLGVTFYHTHQIHLSAGMAAGLPVFMTWVWMWAYNSRSWGTVMTQGKALKETEPGVWKVQNSDLFYYTGAYMRGLLTNAIVMAALLNGDIFHWSTAGVMAANAGVNLFARAWIDKMITDRQATVVKLPDGKFRVEVQPGQHSPLTTARIRAGWETVYGALKTVQLVGHISVIDYVYKIMGVVGLSKKLYSERFALMRKFRQVRDSVSGSEKEEANSDLGPITQALICEGAFL